MKRIIVILFYCLMISLTISGQDKQAEKLLRDAIYQEEVNGDLNDVIKMYESIVTKFPDNRAVAAKAQLHIGICYEKLGLKEARKAYDKVVNNYPDQKNMVTMAKERLTRLMTLAEKDLETPLVPKFTKINIPNRLGESVALSPDGKKLALTSDKKIWKIPLSGKLGSDFPGIPEQLNTDSVEVPEWSPLSWSQNGKWIAFNNGQSIYVVSSDGGKPRKVIEINRDSEALNYRISLSANGNNLAFSSVEENKQHIFSTPVDKVIPRQLVEMEAREPVFSPDGKYIAFVEDKNKGVGWDNLGLWVIEANGSKPYKLADAGKANSPIWSPDGKLIAFLDGADQICIVPFSKTANTISKVIRIDAPEGASAFISLAGWTPDNKIGAFTRNNVKYGLYTLPVEGGQAAIILHDAIATQPRWSKNGEQIYYVTTPEKWEGRGYNLASVSASGGKGKPLKTNYKGKYINQLTFQSGNRVSPDGKLIVTSTWTQADTNTINVTWPASKIWKVSVDGEDAIQVTNTPGNFFDSSPCWSADGKKIAFVHTELIKKDIFGDSHIYLIDSNGGEPELLDPNAGSFATNSNINLIWSPDGKMIAYPVKKKNTEKNILKIIDIESRDVRVIEEFPEINGNTELVWSPDSKRIAFGDEHGKVIKIMNIDDGSIEDIETGLPEVRIIGLDWSPDGKRFVFGGRTNRRNEFWFLENFLPLEKLAQKKTVAEEAPKVMTSKKIWEENEIDNLGQISPDGKYISYTDWPAGDLAIYEIATGKKRRLTSSNYGETWSTGSKTTFVLTSIWSADSRQIIYSTGTGEIRTIGLENSTPRTIRKKETKNEWAVQVYDISEDGKTILGTIETMEKKTQIILVSVRDGEKQIIKELSGFRIVGKKLKFTNDGAGIVYDYPADLDSPVHDIYWLSLDGKTETPIIKHPAHDFVLDLSPDGNQLLFASSRSGKMGFYYVGLKNGKTLGNPKFIKTTEYPNLTGLGFSDNGVFYCFYQPFVTDVYETEINSETGAIVAHPNEIIGSFMGENSAPDYSSDGKYLAFISRRPPFFTRTNGIHTGNVLCVMSLENATLREIKPEIDDFEIPKWSPDNRSILMMNWNAESIREIYKIDLQSEKLSLIFSDKNMKIFDFEWCADGMSIFMVLQYQENDTTKHKLVRYNLETKEEKILYVNHGRKGYFPDLATISCSPDGNWIAFLGLDQKKTIKIISTSGGEVREVYSLDQKKTIDGKQIWSSKSYANLFIHHCWSADGKYIYFQKFREPRGDGIWNLWQLPVNGGSPVNLGLEMTDISQISAHPDGKHFAFSNQGSSYKLPQIWMMENFLPKE